MIQDSNGGEFQKLDTFIIRPNGFEIPKEASDIHGITQEIAIRDGVDSETVITYFNAMLAWSDSIVGHNIGFDCKIMGAELIRHGYNDIKPDKPRFCTMLEGNKKHGGKWPKLQELHKALFGTEFEKAHDARADIEATAKCYWEMVEK